MFALTFFGVLHVPINVPALGLSTGNDNLNVDRELVSHGISNVLAGFAGSVQVPTSNTHDHDTELNITRTISCTQTAYSSYVLAATAVSPASC